MQSGLQPIFTAVQWFGGNKAVIQVELYRYIIILQENITIPLHEASAPSDISPGGVPA